MNHAPTPITPSPLAPVLQPLQAFLSAESAGGIVLMIAAVAALLWANSPWGESYSGFWHAKLAVSFAGHAHAMSLEHWVNDGLMRRQWAARVELGRLQRKRAGLQKQLNVLDRQIERVGGGPNGSRRGGTRSRNEHNLPDTIESVLRGAGKPMKVPEITDAVLAAGYRSGSANFRGIVNQTLIKENRFGQVERGVYRLKASGKSKKGSNKGVRGRGTRP
jgi:hypothetical protein